MLSTKTRIHIECTNTRESINKREWDGEALKKPLNVTTSKIKPENILIYNDGKFVIHNIKKLL